ncbi:MAG TPA: NAD(P)/FAD-dependent oxidoreductase [Pyrinomonadaceae bacterium]|nr:NAD(P)/FAD-dependent oxidoreductase [Pyrinomonadaceae bacterium]HRK50952.1 NAD(P)/FAD-dependent oxidoreductase [Pyrinomonadaceae bacterium]
MGQNIAIVGGGFLGLTIALRCAQRGNTVTIFESASEIGGLASAWQIGGVTWDKHYHVTLLSDQYTRRIVEELGLGEEFRWVETKTGFYTDGKLHSMSNTLEFLRFPPLDILSKLRLGATIFYASRLKNWRTLERIPVEDWLTGLSGRKTFEKMWLPLLRAKLGDAYKQTSAAFIWATIQRMYAARNSGLKKEMFGYVRGGYARVLKRFGEELVQLGVKMVLNSKVEAVEATQSDGVRIECKGTFQDFDKAVLTCPPKVAAKLLPQLTAEERLAYEAIRYQGIICVSVLLKQPISDFYVTNITDDTPFTGIIEMSALVDKSEFGGNSLVYLPKYVESDDPIFDVADDKVVENFLTGFAAMYANFRREDVVDLRISRVREVFPLPVLNYSAGIPNTSVSIPNVFVLNSSHITNGTLNVNETIQLAEDFSMAEYI